MRVERILVALAVVGIPFLVGEGIGEQRAVSPPCRAELPDGRQLILERRDTEGRAINCMYQQPGRKKRL